MMRTPISSNKSFQTFSFNISAAKGALKLLLQRDQSLLLFGSLQ